MNFFERQDHARQETRKLVLLFCATVLAMTGGIYLAAATTLGSSGRNRCTNFDTSQAQINQPYTRLSTAKVQNPEPSGQATPANLYAYRRPFGCIGRVEVFNPGLFFLVTVGTLGIVSVGSITKIAQLSAGGKVVAESLGGRLIDPDQANAQERQLLNVVEEMSIASGIPVPPVYLLEQETGMNAFAAGMKPENAVIGVTQGLLEALNRDQLQGVIGHEFSHILNGDMGLNIKLMGVINGLLFIYLAGRMLLYIRSDRDNNGAWLFGLSLIALGLLGMLGGRLLQSAVSRQREFLADASAVQFTRNPDGIAGALEKLAGIGSQIQNPEAETASHLFFGNALSSFWSADWFATHPPLKERIARLRNLPLEVLQAEINAASPVSSQSSVTGAAVAGFAGSPSPQTSSGPITPAEVISQVGSVTPDHHAHARSLLALMPENLREQVRQPLGAIATLYALFVEATPNSIQRRQLQVLQEHEPQAIMENVVTKTSQIAQLDPRLRLPLLDLTIPALRQCSPEVLQNRLLPSVKRLAEADGNWTLSEFLQELILKRRLEGYLPEPSAPTMVIKTLTPVWADCLLILAALASAGSTEPERVELAFRSGVKKLPENGSALIPASVPTWTQVELETSLGRLRQLIPKLQQSLINACAYTVLLDSDVTLAEAELMRAIAITLDCPMPPFLQVTK